MWTHRVALAALIIWGTAGLFGGLPGRGAPRAVGTPALCRTKPPDPPKPDDKKPKPKPANPRLA